MAKDCIEAVIFDLDGTLVETDPLYRYITVGRIMNDFGKYTYNKSDADAFWFETDRNRIIKERFGIEPDAYWERYRFYDTVENRSRFMRAYKDTDAIKRIKERGIKTGIVSSAPENIAKYELYLLGWENFDNVKLARVSNGYKPKPDPQALFACIKELGIRKEAVIYIGNGEEDALMCQNAGVECRLIDRNEYAFSSLNGTKIIKSLYEIEDELALVLGGK